MALFILHYNNQVANISIIYQPELDATALHLKVKVMQYHNAAVGAKTGI